MRKVATGLYRSELEWPFGNEVTTCSYLLVRKHGNAIVFSSNRWREDEDEIRRLGGVASQYLNHRDEASPACEWVYRSFGAKVTCHGAERTAVEKQCTVASSFEAEVLLADDLLAIPTPGHCPGSTCYLWNGVDGRCLFTGDTLYLSQGRLRVFTSPQQRHEMIQSLRLIRGLDFDCLVPGLFIGQIERREIHSMADFRSELDEVIARVEGGEMH